MGRTYQAYAPEVRGQMVEPAKSRRTPSELAQRALGYRSPAAFKDLQPEAAA